MARLSSEALFRFAAPDQIRRPAILFAAPRRFVRRLIRVALHPQHQSKTRTRSESDGQPFPIEHIFANPLAILIKTLRIGEPMLAEAAGLYDQFTLFECGQVHDRQRHGLVADRLDQRSYVFRETAAFADRIVITDAGMLKAAVGDVHRSAERHLQQPFEVDGAIFPPLVNAVGVIPVPASRVTLRRPHLLQLYGDQFQIPLQDSLWIVGKLAAHI